MKIGMISQMVLAMLLVVLMSGAGYAQRQDGGGGGMGGGGQGRGGFDPSQIRQRMNESIKEARAVTDEEWSVLSPRIERVQTLQADAGGGVTGALGMMGRMGRGGGGNRNMMAMMGGMGMSAEMQRATQELAEAVENKDVSDQVLKQRLNAVRDLRVKAKAELEKARAELIALLTSRQEATLFQMGLVE